MQPTVEQTVEQLLAVLINETTLVYGGLVGFYFVVAPLALYLYLQKRWYVAGAIERLFAYFGVFLFFPGLLLFAPILNFRPQRRAIPD